MVAYEDRAVGVMELTEDGGGHFTEATLRPAVRVAEESMAAKALELHSGAHELCFVASSVNFPVRHEPRVEVAPRSPS